MADARMQFLVGLLLGAICGGLAREVALSKGRDGWRWFGAGFLFGPLGLIAVAGISDRKNHMLLNRLLRVSSQIEEEIDHQAGH